MDRNRYNHGQNAGQAYVPTCLLKPLVEQLAIEEGRSLQSILQRTGISLNVLKAPDAMVTFDQQVRLYDRVAELSTSPGIGFRSPSAQSFSDQGMVGALMVLAPTVGDAFGMIEQYADVVGAMVRYHMHVKGKRVHLTTADQASLSPAAHRLVAEENLVIWKGASAALPGLENFLDEVHLDYAKPLHWELYQALFPDAVIRFGQSRTAAVFSNKVLSHPVQSHNPDAFRAIEASCKDLLARMRPTTIGLVEQFLARTDPGNWYAYSIADGLNLTQKTLTRRLNGEGSSTKQIIERRKLNLARTLIDQGHGDREIASRLDYANSHSFARAFRNWSGETPASYRLGKPRQ